MKFCEIDGFLCSDLEGKDYSEEAFLATNYEKITHNHLSRLYAQLPDGLKSMLHAEKRGERFYFRAFGEECCLGPEMITLSDKPIVDPRAVLISLYEIVTCLFSANALSFIPLDGLADVAEYTSNKIIQVIRKEHISRAMRGIGMQEDFIRYVSHRGFKDDGQ
jgi:hypothetical protein